MYRSDKFHFYSVICHIVKDLEKVYNSKGCYTGGTNMCNITIFVVIITIILCFALWHKMVTKTSIQTESNAFINENYYRLYENLVIYDAIYKWTM